MDVVSQRDPHTEGVKISGTYMAYFIENQKNLSHDGILLKLGRDSEDQDPCKFYMRMKKSGLKYIAIDPNIVSVATNVKDTLFRRVVGDINYADKEIYKQGVMAMFADLIDQGYVDFMYSNNIGVQYGYGLSKDELMSYIVTHPDPTARQELERMARKDVTLLRTLLYISRYYGQDASELFGSLIIHIFQTRFQTGEAMEELSYIFGKEVDAEKLKSLIKPLMSGQITVEQEGLINDELTDDERFMLLQYLQLLSLGRN